MKPDKIIKFMSSDFMRSQKAEATTLMQMLTLFFAIGVMAFIYFFFY
jgi:hypothetical protein